MHKKSNGYHGTIAATHMAQQINLKMAETYRKLSPKAGASEYVALRAAVSQAGILQRAYGYYFFLTVFSLTGFFGSLWLLLNTPRLEAFAIWTVVFAFFTIQLGGLIHDAAHRGIFTSVHANNTIGQICSVLTAFSFSNWMTIHNAHHAHPNEEELDPDLGVPYSFSKEQWDNATGLRRAIRKYQVFLYYPLGSFAMTLMRVNNCMYYLQAVLNRKLIREAFFFGFGMVAWYGVPFVLFPFGKALLFVVLVSLASGAYMSAIFAPNHKGMPQIGKHVPFSFLEQQIITSRNIYGHWLTDFIYLGLNYQIEHHLFPNCPRNKLKLISPYVQALCKKYDLPYEQTSVFGIQKIIIGQLREVASIEGKDTVVQNVASIRKRT